MKGCLVFLAAAVLIFGAVQTVGVSDAAASVRFGPIRFIQQEMPEGMVYMFSAVYYNDECIAPPDIYMPPQTCWPLWDYDEMHPRKIVDSANEVHIVWMREVDVLGIWEIWYVEMTAAGVLINGPMQVSDVDGFDSEYPSIALDSNDDAHVVWADKRLGNTEIYYSKIGNGAGGLDLTVPDVALSDIDLLNSGRIVAPEIDSGESCLYIEHPDVAVDAADSVHVVWSDQRHGPWEVYYQKQDNGAIPGVGINDLLISDNDGHASQCPAVAIGENNTVHIAWQDARDLADWEIYYQQQDSDAVVIHVHDARRSGPDDDYNSALPDIDVENGPDFYVHIVFQDQREEDPGCPDEWHITNNWEIYTTILHANGTEIGGVPKRQSDVKGGGWWGGQYMGPPDGHSMYPQIAVEDDHDIGETYIKWHDMRDGNWEIYDCNMHNWCNNPMTDIRVTNDPSADMYPAIALDDIDQDYNRHPDNKWQSNRDGTWRIYNARMVEDEWVLFQIDTGSDIISYAASPEPGDDDASDGILYRYGLPVAEASDYVFRFTALDCLGRTASTSWSTTHAQLSSFTAARYDGYVEVSWSTATEIDNAGFNLYRSRSEDGGRTRLNEGLIPSRGDELQGASYSFKDHDVISGAAYYYWFEDVDLNGGGSIHGPVMVSGKEERPTPTVFSLAQNYPNPFNPVTEIMYVLPVDCHVSLEIYNVLGQRVTALVSEHQKAGEKVVQWNGKDASGMDVTSGVYFYKLHAGSYSEIKKMVLMR